MSEQSLTEKSTIKVNAVSAITIVVAIVSGTIFSIGWLNEYKAKTNDAMSQITELAGQNTVLQETMWQLQSQLKSAAAYQWTVRDMTDWGRETQAGNMQVMREGNGNGLVLPDAREIHENNL